MSAIRRIDAGWAVRMAGVASLVAQQTTSAMYRPPTLVLAYPAPGASVPGDNAAVVFQYAAGGDGDPLDLRSFRVLVDGVDRTSHFQATADAAWGTIAHSEGKGIRAHEVRARLCTIRGACSQVSAVITVIGAGGRKPPAVANARWIRLIDVTLEMLRRLLKP